MKSIILSLLLLLIVSNIYSEEIRMYIGDELMTREMPNDIEELKQLVLGIVKIQNKSNDTIMEYRSKVDELNDSINQLKINNDLYIKELSLIKSQMETNITDLENNIDEIKFNIFGVGLSLGYSSPIGMYGNINLMFNIKDKIQIGPNVGFNKQFTNADTNFNVGINFSVWLF